MEKPNFRDLKKLIRAINDTNSAFRSIYSDRQLQEKNIRTLCGRLTAADARKALYDISVEELRKAKAGIRVQSLTDAGYTNLGQIAAMTDYELQSIDGIGEKQCEAIKGIITDLPTVSLPVSLCG